MLTIGIDVGDIFVAQTGSRLVEMTLEVTSGFGPQVCVPALMFAPAAAAASN